MLSHQNPLGYRQLLTWKQANEILDLTEKYLPTIAFKNPVTGQPTTDIKDHINRSARSLVRNIEEGYARTSTREYISFLGFSAGSLEELIGDFKNCQKHKLGDQDILSKLIGLSVGEAKMLSNQIKALENKTFTDKTASQKDLVLNRMKENKKKDAEFDKYLQDYLNRNK